MKMGFNLPFGEGVLRISSILKGEGDGWAQFWVLCSVSFYCKFLRPEGGVTICDCAAPCPK